MTRAVCIGECMVELAPAGADLYRRGFAGDVFNTAVYLKRCAPQLDVQFATVTGADAMSHAMRDAWSQHGVGDVLAAVEPDRRPGLYLIELDEQRERSFHYWRGESAARGWARHLAALAQSDALDGVELVYLSGISLAILTPDDRKLAHEILEGLRGRVKRIAYDPNLRPSLWGDLALAKAALEQMADLADVLLPSRQDLQLLTGEPDIDRMAAWLAGLGAAEFAITAEDQGCLVYDGEKQWLPAPKVAQVVDTSGAGDSFNGAYLAARLAGQTPAEAAQAGLAMGAYVVTQPGAVAPNQANASPPA